MTKFILDVVKCPRCGMDHQVLAFEFVNPIVMPGATPGIGSEAWTHFAYCDNWNEPILVARIDNGEGTVAFWRFA